MKTTVQVLQEARGLILDHANWGRGKYVDGEKICASEALRRAYDDSTREYLDSDGYNLLKQVMGDVTVCHFNDTHTHAEVIYAFDRAIAGFEG